MKLSDFIQIEIKDGIGICWIDHRFEKMNVVSPDVIGLFEELMPLIENNKDIKAVVLISRKSDFMAGADIKSFQIEKAGDFRPFQAKGHEALMRLEHSKKPFVAAVHGACFGLGTEMALACHARIASNSPRTKFGLPEVKLGILPGGGGTQRLPRRIGIQKALDMMLTGKNVFARTAKRWGLVDELTDEGKLLQAAIMMAKSMIDIPLVRKRKRTLMEKILEGPLKSVLFSQAKKIALKQSQGNYPAIPAIIECVQTGYTKGVKAGLEKELEWFEKLMLTNESKALRSMFFAMSDNKNIPYPNPRKTHTLGMIGAGFMGAGIAEITATNNIQVLLKDIKEDVLNGAYKQIWTSIDKKRSQGALTKIESEQLLGNVTGQLTYDNFKTVDVVIEAVLEEMPLKKRIIDDIQTNCKNDVIIATNTSSLSVSEMSNHANKPEMVIGMHYFSPVPKMPLLEIVKTKHTADWVIATCYALGLKQGKTCIVVNDGPGFYVNRILAPYTNECLIMAEEGLALDVIDRALIKKGFPVGPITLIDQVGLDIAAHVTESSRKIVGGRKGFEISEAVIKMNADGRKGRKAGLGFYKYKNGRKQKLDPQVYKYFKGAGKKELPLSEIQDRALMLMLNEAVLCLEEKIIANAADGDLGAVFGIGFLPFTGGPFRAIDTWGVKTVVDRMLELKEKYGDRFEPAKTLVGMAKLGSKFH